MRPIDAVSLEAKAKTIYMEYENVAVPTRVIPISELHLAPTIDAEPVVRCRDCTYYRPEPYGDVLMCYEFANGHWTHPDDYCSRGKRKEVEVQDD